MTADSTMNYSTIQNIVWHFADMMRDNSSGTVEDYAKIVLPTTLVKRTMDLQKEFIQKNGKSFFDLVDMGISTVEQALKDINAKSYKFFDFDVIVSKKVQPTVMLLSWDNLMNYSENPNKEVKTVNVMFGQKYETQAADFIELMFEYVDVLNNYMQYVFTTFEYKSLLLHKNVIPVAIFSKECHDGLNKYEFTMENISTDMFSDIYMDLIGRFAHDSGKKGGEFFTPTKLVKSAWQFLDIKRIANQLANGERTTLSIGDPTAGSNTFLVYGYELIKQACEEMKAENVSANMFQFYAQELKGFQYCLGLMNMIFHNMIDQYNQGIPISNQNNNVITNYSAGIGTQKGRLDLVVANPPYGTKDYGYEDSLGKQTTDSRWATYGVPIRKEGEMAFLLTIVDLLNEMGKSVVVMPLGTLFRNSGAALREKLLTNDLIEGIVTLPSNMFLTTTIPVCLWILNKHKDEQDKNKVFMVNATQDFIKVGKFNDWQTDISINAYLGREVIEDYSGYATVEEIKKNKFNLSVQRYFSKTEEEEEIDLVALEAEIAELNGKIQANSAEIADIIAQAIALENIDEAN